MLVVTFILQQAGFVMLKLCPSLNVPKLSPKASVIAGILVTSGTGQYPNVKLAGAVEVHVAPFMLYSVSLLIIADVTLSHTIFSLVKAKSVSSTQIGTASVKINSWSTSNGGVHISTNIGLSQDAPNGGSGVTPHGPQSTITGCLFISQLFCEFLYQTQNCPQINKIA
jgi:hypothetical protein